MIAGRVLNGPWREREPWRDSEGRIRLGGDVGTPDDHAWMMWGRLMVFASYEAGHVLDLRQPEVTKAMLDAAWTAAVEEAPDDWGGLHVSQEYDQIDGVIDMSAIIRAALRAQK